MPSVSPKPTHANPTIYSLTTNATTTNSDAYILRVSSDSTTNVLTIASNKSHLIQNEGSNSFVLATTGNGNLTINAGGQARATWSSSTSQHELQDDQISVTVDTARTAASADSIARSWQMCETRSKRTSSRMMTNHLSPRQNPHGHGPYQTWPARPQSSLRRPWLP